MKKLVCLILICLLGGLCAYAETGLSDYRYSGNDSYVAAICDWLIENEADNYAQGEVAIPCPIIAEVDDRDHQDILVWGCFELNWYELRNTTLFCVSGGSTPGLMHLQEKDGGYTVIGFDAVGDGSDYSKDMMHIFGMRNGLMTKLEAVMASKDKTQLEFVSEYVNPNKLNITQMQDFGWPPVPLINAPLTSEENQIVHYTSALGYSIDYDLRTFSFDVYDEAIESLSGVGEMQGISIDIQKCAASEENVLADFEKDMDHPVRDSVTIGADAVPATLLRDAALPENVHKYYYTFQIGNWCFAICTSNTFYSYADAVVVDGADAEIEKAIASFRINHIGGNAVTEEYEILYSNLASSSAQNKLREIMDAASISAKRQEVFFDHVNQFNVSVNSKNLVAEFENLNNVAEQYDPYEMQDEWNRASPDFIGYNCRITTFGLMADYMDVSADCDVREEMVLVDLAALEEDPSALDGGNEKAAFCALYSTVPTSLTKDTGVHVQNLQNDWNARGIRFHNNEIASLIFVVFHESITEHENYLFIGHAGVLFDYDDKLYFVEKIAFQEPYQLTVFHTRAQLNDYLMKKYDCAFDQPTASPFILENTQLLAVNDGTKD